MPVQKAQMHRLIRIAAMLKENRYPNVDKLVNTFRRIAVEEELNIDCGRKTVLRDMKALKEEFGCPLGFDRNANGYYLKHHGWDFIVPALLDENEMLAAVIGARISEAIFPPPLKNKIRNAVDYLLQNNNPDFLDTARLDSLKILSGLYINLDKDIFMTIFNGWQMLRCIRISYADYTGNMTERIIEPHTLVFFENSWYTKGWCRTKKAPRTFALQRIKKAELMDGTFSPDKGIIDSVNTDDFLSFQKVKNVRLKISDHVRERLLAAPLHSNQVIKGNTVKLPAVSRETLFPFLLSQRGEAVLMSPVTLRQEFKAELEKILSEY